MSRKPFDRNINPYMAVLAITVVGAGAALALRHAIDLLAVAGLAPAF